MVIALKGDVDADVLRLVELCHLLLRRSIKELVLSQADSVKVKQCNPWVAIQHQDDPIQENHLIVNYVDYSSENLLDIDLLQQILYMVGMLKKIQNKEHQERAREKVSENKRLYNEIHKDLPKERSVYDVIPESILGQKRKVVNLDKPETKDIKGDKDPTTITESNSNKKEASSTDAIDISNSNLGLFASIKSKLSFKIPISKEKKEKEEKRNKLVGKLSLIENKYLTNGILDGEQPNTQDILFVDYTRDFEDSIKGIKVIESILNESLKNKDAIDPNYINYSFVDVTAGISVKVKWRSNKYDI